MTALTPRTKLVVVDHITAQSALVLPVAAIAAECHARGVPVLVDGAHAPGSIALDIPATGADWYAANLHKWAHAPRVVRHPVGEARASGHASSPHRLVGIGSRISRGVRAPRPPAIRRAISRRRKGSRSCASGISTRSSATCTASRGSGAPLLTERWGTTLDAAERHDRRDGHGAAAGGGREQPPTKRRACGWRSSSRIASRCQLHAWRGTAVGARLAPGLQRSIRCHASGRAQS